MYDKKSEMIPQFTQPFDFYRQVKTRFSVDINYELEQGTFLVDVRQRMSFRMLSKNNTNG